METAGAKTLNKLKFLASLLCTTAVLVSAGAANARPRTEVMPNRASSAPTAYVNPYRAAQQCVAGQLTPQQRQTTIGIGYWADRTGRDSYSQENGAGRFFSQGAEDQLINDLADTGMTAVDVSPANRALTDWQAARMAASNVAMPPFAAPDILVYGSFSTADFGSSNVRELYILGIGGGNRAYTLRYTVDARAVRMPGASGPNLTNQPAGVLMAHVAFQKDVVGYETRAGVAGFFGPSSSSTYVQLNVSNNSRELVQYSQRYMTTRTAIGIVIDLWDITGCEEQIAYGDNLITGNFPNGNDRRSDQRPTGTERLAANNNPPATARPAMGLAHRN